MVIRPFVFGAACIGMLVYIATMSSLIGCAPDTSNGINGNGKSVVVDHATMHINSGIFVKCPHCGNLIFKQINQQTAEEYLKARDGAGSGVAIQCLQETDGTVPPLPDNVAPQDMGAVDPTHPDYKHPTQYLIAPPAQPKELTPEEMRQQIEAQINKGN